MKIGSNIPDIVRALIEMSKRQEDPSYTIFLPLLRFEGHPYSLKFHYQLEPLYRMRQPRRFCLKTARQVGKSQGIVSLGVLKAGLTPNNHMMICEPQFQQVRNISNITFRNMVNQSYIANYLTSRKCNNSMLIREFTSGSRVHFAYIGDDASRIRGVSAIKTLLLDEVDDMEIDVINIAAETMSAVREGGTYMYTGTPKLEDGTLPYYFNKSSGGEITIKCEACNKINVACIEQDLLQMIGKTTCICAKCGRPLDVRKSYYSFRNPERRAEFDGFHMSQVTHPLHCTSEAKWRELLLKMETMPPAQFKNECLGEACDEAVRIITRKDLEEATTGRDNTLDEAMKVARNFSIRVLSVDWGGYGLEGESFTVLSILGLQSMTNTIETLYIEKIPTGRTHAEQVGRVIMLAGMFDCAYIAHDATGAGAIKEEMLRQEMGAGGILTVPLVYLWAPRQDTLRFIEPSIGHAGYYSLDKTRSLALTMAAIKAKKLLVPNYRSCASLLEDFLALGEDIRSTQTQGEIRIITRMGAHPDDTAHAINLGANAIWYTNQCRPELGAMVSKYENLPDWASEGSELKI